ncbi:MAG TPA: hypothetical protein VD763_10165, partial [Candidatus Saccharimonadales bacterium]|nr:hypothetical protein [Candidatus Saccharimonadales bacterium]
GPATARQDGRPWDLVIFEGTLPTTLPSSPILAIAPPRSSALGDVTGTLTNPGIGSLDPAEPVLRYVDLATTHISEATKLALPDWARTIIPGPRGAPLLYAGDRAGLPTAVLAFEPRRSDLPLQVAFPILLANLTGELLGGSAAPTEAVEPGSPVELVIPPGAIGLTVTSPDGTETELAPASSTSATVTFASTGTPGIYTVTPVADPAASPDPSAAGGAASARPTASGTARPSGSAAGGLGASPAPSAPPDDPLAPVRFAVDLFDVDESTIAPGSVALIEGLGRTATGSPGPGASGEPTTGAATTRPTTRDELWVPIVLIILLVLCVEWALYHRDALVKLRRQFSTRFGRDTSGTA